jgi:pectin methylesterase-like acyl-CoA thioesterase
MLITSALKRFLLLSVLCLAAIGMASSPEDIADMVVAQDGSGDFTKVQDAVNAVPNNKSIQTVIFIKPGTYKEKINVSADKKNLKFVGESYENTILTFDDYAGKTKDYASTCIAADDFTAVGITFQNTIDSRTQGIKGGQAAALRVDGDRAVFYKCRIMGFQDTYYTGGNKRSYHRDCIIIGTTDFIYGNGIALFENCTIYNRKDSHVTAHCQKLKDGKSQNKFGYVFKHCKIKVYPGETVAKASLGRPWGNGARVVYLYCEIDSHIKDEGWSIWRGRENHKTAYYAEYKNRGPGYKPKSRLDWTHQLTDEEAAAYTRENIFKANTTTAVTLEGDWNPNVDELGRTINTSTVGSTLPAFPGAEGYGSTTPGGRGGRVIEVTNLNDSGPGSLRAAVEAKGPRIVVFRVSGTIALESDLSVRNPYLTIAGQTAPGGGICLRNRKLIIETNDVIVRYLRIRVGREGGGNDALAIDEGSNVVVDHCSLSWGCDETLNTWHGARDITVQWCIISEALHHRNHGFAASLGGENASFHHLLIAHCPGRNPSIGGNNEHQTINLDFRNSVIYNFGHRTFDGKPSSINIVNNYYKPGPNSSVKRFAEIDDVGGYEKIPTTAWYISGNVWEGDEAITQDNASGVTGATQWLVNEPAPYAPVRTVSAERAYALVLADVGAILPKRDSVDIRVIEDVRTGTATFGNGKGVILHQDDVGGWPELKSQPAPEDSDSDGMRDEWESKFGLDPKNANDNIQDKDKDGYTNIEEYLNGTDPTVFVDYTRPENNVNTLK